MPGGRDRALFLSLAGFALLLIVGVAVYRAPAPQPASAAAHDFSAGRAHAVLQRLVGNATPHPLGSADNERMRGAIVARLRELGYATDIEAGYVCSDFGVCGAPSNIVATRSGGEDGRAGAAPGDALLLAAHYDSVPAGAGASDDAAGVAAVLEIARILTLEPRLRHEVVLLISDGEEAGLLGAELFVRNHPLAGRIKAAVNLEARGTSGPSLMFETGSANRWLMRLYGQAIAHPMTNSLFYLAYKALPNNTDFSIFKRASYQGYNFAYVGGVARYHTPHDDLEHASLASLQHQGNNALAVLQALDRRAELAPQVGEAVYFDVLAQTLVAWPAAASAPAALVSAAVLSLLAGVLLARRWVRPAQILRGTLTALAHLLGGSLGAALLVGALTWAGMLPSLDGGPFVAHPLPMAAACVALAVAVGGGLGIAAHSRAGFWGLWCGGALTMQALAIALAVFAPGACFVPLVASFAICAAATPCVLHAWRGRPAPLWQADLAVLFPCLLTAALVLPMVLLLYTALGTPAWPLDALAASLATLLLLPALAGATRRARVRITSVAAAVAGIGVALTLLLPTYSVASPLRLNFTYRLDVDAHRADWLAVTAAGRLPRAVADAARFERNDDDFRAPAPYHEELAAPQVEVSAKSLRRHGSSTFTHYVVHLDSARHAPRAFLVFPRETGVRRVCSETSAGVQQFDLRGAGFGATRLDIASLPPGGVDVAFDTDAQAPRLIAGDLSYGLPADGAALQRARPADATSSQDGDVTMVQLTVDLPPASGRGNTDLSPP